MLEERGAGERVLEERNADERKCVGEREKVVEKERVPEY